MHSNTGIIRLRFMLLLLPGQGPDRDPVYLVPDPDYLVLGPVGQDLADRDPVSYTHLTLPTTSRV